MIIVQYTYFFMKWKCFIINISIYIIYKKYELFYATLFDTCVNAFLVKFKYIYISVAAIISNSKITKGFCRHDHVNLTLTADCDFTGIYVSILYDKADLSTMILQCEHPNLTCYSFRPIAFRLTNEMLEVSFRFKHKEHAGRYVNFNTICQNQTAAFDQVFLKPCCK